MVEQRETSGGAVELSLVDALPFAAIAIERDTFCIIAASPTAHALYGYPGPLWSGLTLFDLCAAGADDPLIDAAESLAPGECYRGTSLHRDAAGHEHETHVVAVAALLAGRAVLLLHPQMDRRVEHAEAVEAARRAYGVLLEAAGALVCVADTQGRIIAASPAARHLFGSTLLGGDVVEQALLHPAGERDRFRAAFAIALDTGSAEIDAVTLVAHGDKRIAHLALTRLAGFDPRPTDRGDRPAPAREPDPTRWTSVASADVCVQTVIRLDAGSAHASGDHAQSLDPLSGLSNRSRFLARLDHALARQRSGGPQLAVLFLNIDRFKTINDSLGPRAGDAVLVAMARRIERCVREEDTVSRLGGDEFAILIEAVGQPEDVVRVAQRIVQQVREPVLVGGRELFVTPSIGIALAASDERVASDAAGVLRDAGVAMRRAKGEGQGQYAIFDAAMNAKALDRLDLETALRRAIERGEIVAYFQPIIDLASGAIRSCEALVRWRHPERGLIPPDRFIAIAEEIGLLARIDEWVLTLATARVQEWRQTLPSAADLRLSVNFSARQFQHPNVTGIVAAGLDRSGLPASALGIEVTETTLLDDRYDPAGRLRALKALGIGLLMDDFGTGYSSLAYLRRFPVDTLKIDRAFISRLGADESDTAIVRAVVGLARALHLSVVGEGIETAEQWHLLREIGCHYGQGYYFSRPLDADAFAALVATSPIFTLPASQNGAVPVPVPVPVPATATGQD